MSVGVPGRAEPAASVALSAQLPIGPGAPSQALPTGLPDPLPMLAPIDELPFGLLVLDAQGRVLQANRLIAQTLRRADADLVGMPFVSLLDAGSAWLWEMFALPRLSLTGHLEGVSVTCASESGERPLVINARSFRIGAATAYRLALVDGAMQREQTRRGAAAAARANRLARVVENATEPVVLVDAALRIVAHNHATVTFLGLSGDQLLGRSLEACLAATAQPGRDIGSVIRAQARGEPAEAEFRFGTDAGAARAAMIKATALHASAEDDPAYGVFLIDMTERRRLEALHEAMREAEVAARERRDVLSRVSHEFLTPLNAVLGFTRMAMDDRAAERSPQLSRQLAQIRSAGQQLVTLVDAVLGLTREGGPELMAPVRVPLGVLLQRCVAGAAPQAQREDVRVQAVCADERAEVTVPLIQVEQCLANLLSNAIRYNERGGTVQVRAKVRGDRLLLQVVDDGPGLERGSLQRAFLPFERLDAEHRGIEGVGLGLAVSRSILARMGGTLRARSRPHRMTIFTADLPARVAAQVMPIAAADPSRDSVCAPGGRAWLTPAAVGLPVAGQGGDEGDAGDAGDAGDQADGLAGAGATGADAAATGRFTVLLAESSPFPRMLVEMAFAEFPDWQLLVADDADALRATCATHRPDVVLLEEGIARSLGPAWFSALQVLPGAVHAHVVLMGDPRALTAAGDGVPPIDSFARPLSIPLLVQRLSALASACRSPPSSGW